MFDFTVKHRKYDMGVLVMLNYFLLPISRESIVFGSNFRSGDFDGFTSFDIL